MIDVAGRRDDDVVRRVAGPVVGRDVGTGIAEMTSDGRMRRPADVSPKIASAG